jgi:hypothetical protein
MSREKQQRSRSRRSAIAPFSLLPSNTTSKTKQKTGLCMCIPHTAYRIPHIACPLRWLGRGRLAPAPVVFFSIFFFPTMSCAGQRPVVRPWRWAWAGPWWSVGFGVPAALSSAALWELYLGLLALPPPSVLRSPFLLPLSPRRAHFPK